MLVVGYIHLCFQNISSITSYSNKRKTISKNIVSKIKATAKCTFRQQLFCDGKKEWIFYLTKKRIGLSLCQHCWDLKWIWQRFQRFEWGKFINFHWQLVYKFFDVLSWGLRLKESVGRPKNHHNLDLCDKNHMRLTRAL